jgi:hypothetical protein
MTTKGTKPAYVVATVIERGRGERDRWTDIGVALHNPRTDTYTIELDATPVNGHLVLYKPKRWTEHEPPAIDVQ